MKHKISRLYALQAKYIISNLFYNGSLYIYDVYILWVSVSSLCKLCVTKNLIPVFIKLKFLIVTKSITVRNILLNF